MRSLDHWRLKNEAKLRILRSEKKRTGNELPDNKVVAGGDLKTGPKQFSGQLEGFKGKITDGKPQPEGLGDKGMAAVGKSTFANPVGAGETPTISNGIPVGEPKGQFEGFKTRVWSELQMAAPPTGETGAPPLDSVDPSAPEVGNPLGADQQAGIMPGTPPKGIPPYMTRYLDRALQGAENLGVQKMRSLWQYMNQMMHQKMQASQASDSMGRSVQRQTALNLRGM